MSTTATQTGAGDVDIGQVFSRSFDILFRNLVKFVALNAIVFLPLLAYQLVFQRTLGGGQATNAIGGLLGFVLAFVAQAAALYGAFQQMRQKPFEIGESLQKGLRRLGPVVGTAICAGLGTMFGFILLIVPGLILLTMWYVALPACVLENVGPFEALSRSAFLTKGNRWKVFGIAVVIGILAMIASFVLTAVLGFAIGWIGIIVASYLSDVLIYSFGSVVVAVVYHDLRVAKEGVDVERIVAVFE